MATNRLNTALVWLAGALSVFIWIWAIFAVAYLSFLPAILSRCLAVAFFVIPIAAYFRWPHWRRASRAVLYTAAAVAVAWMFVTPSNERDWAVDQAVLPSATVSDSTLAMKNIRWVELDDANNLNSVRHLDRDFQLESLIGVWLGVEYFTDLRSLAHTFVSFEFEATPHNQFLTFSVEIRREKGESYGLLPGAFRQFELMYVVSDERNMIGNRMLTSNDRFYLYPIRADTNSRRALLLDMVERMNRLQSEPEFYNSFSNNCTNNLVWHLNRVASNRLSTYHPKIVFPGFCDRAVYDLGLIDTESEFAEARQQFRIDEELGRTQIGDPDFSSKIRQGAQQVSK